MPTEGFFHRWSRLKAEPEAASAETVPLPHVDAAVGQTRAAVPLPADRHEPARLPTLADVAALGADSDYSAFVARDVDKAVRRSAMKKLFSDPHFNIGDGLDIYMGDYNKPDPIPAAMLAAMRHSQSFFAQAYPEKAQEDDPPELDGEEEQAVPQLADIDHTEHQGLQESGQTGASDAAKETNA